MEESSMGDSNIARTYPGMIETGISSLIKGQGDIGENINSVIGGMRVLFALGSNYILANGQTPTQFNSDMFNQLNNYVRTISDSDAYIADISAFQNMFRDRLIVENYDD